MSDQLEKFIQKNRDKLDQQNPGNEVWTNVQQGLASNAAAGSGAASTGAAAKTGLAAKIAQLSVGVKVALGVAATAVIATTIYVATSVGSGSGTETMATNEATPPGGVTPPPPTEQVASPFRRVEPPIPSLDIAMASYEVDARKGGTVQTESGTQLIFPKNAFVDADGNKIKGTVEIKYREFGDAFDAMLSGIPMDLEVDGKTEHFQTAGMMEISGSQAGAPVYLAEGKNYEVKIASFAPIENISQGDAGGAVDSYNLYEFDQDKGKWIEIGKPVASQNVERAAQISVLEKEKKASKKPRKPRKAQADELDDAIAIKFKTNDFPELKPFKDVRWEAIDKEYMDANQWALTRRWSDVKLEKLEAENEYRITFSNRKKKFELDVVPMLAGKDYDKAMAQFEKKLAKYNKLAAQRENELERLRNQATVLRSFQASGFGIFNCDRIYQGANPIFVNLDIDYDQDVYVDPHKTQYFQIAGDNRALINRTFQEVESGFGFSPSEQNFLVVVLPGRKIAALRPNDFKKVEQEHNKGKKVVPVTLQTIEYQVNTALDLRVALGI